MLKIICKIITNVRIILIPILSYAITHLHFPIQLLADNIIQSQIGCIEIRFDGNNFLSVIRTLDAHLIVDLFIGSKIV